MSGPEGDLPRDVAADLAVGIGAYIRSCKLNELPPALRPFHGFRDKALKGRAARLVEALNDEGLRAQMAKWLEDEPRLPVEVAAALRIACERDDGWVEALKGLARDAASTSAPAIDATELDREKDKTRKARRELRELKERLDSDLGKERARADEADQARRDAEARLEQAERDVAAAQQAAAMAAERRDKDARKAAREAQGLKRERDAVKGEARTLRRALAKLEQQAEDATSAPTASPAPKPAAPDPPAPTRRRRLKAPAGRLDRDPATLDVWLDTDRVTLVIDGYNVTMSEHGPSELDLAGQRERLIEAVAVLARRKKLVARVVFDGSDVAVAALRKARDAVRVEYTAEGVIADDRIVELLEDLPKHPVIVVTNDRELQGRAARLGATVAWADQLLGLLR